MTEQSRWACRWAPGWPNCPTSGWFDCWNYGPICPAAAGNISALAARAQTRQSVKAATDELDFLRLAVLDALLVLHATPHPYRVPKLSR